MIKVRKEIYRPTDTNARMFYCICHRYKQQLFVAACMHVYFNLKSQKQVLAGMRNNNLSAICQWPTNPFATNPNLPPQQFIYTVPYLHCHI